MAGRAMGVAIVLGLDLERRGVEVERTDDDAVEDLMKSSGTNQYIPWQGQEDGKQHEEKPLYNLRKMMRGLVEGGGRRGGRMR